MSSSGKIDGVGVSFCVLSPAAHTGLDSLDWHVSKFEEVTVFGTIGVVLLGRPISWLNHRTRKQTGDRFVLSLVVEVHISLEMWRSSCGGDFSPEDDITSESSDDVLDMVFVSLSVVVQRETPGSKLGSEVVVANHGKLKSGYSS